tara:strand:- start:7172 stop:8176 length:1005 start_codon:yes stop_codon:yes gene_type:complete
MINILLIGAGKIGSRHLQALSQVKIKNTKIFIVDLSRSALDVAKSRFNEMPANNNIISTSYTTKIDDIEEDSIDLAIVATTSDHRKLVIKDLCSSFRVKNIILEKFLFQDEDSYAEVSEILLQSEAKAWVNCPRRQWDFYNNLKKKLLNSKIIQFDVIGTKWSIATSAIHFIDLISFLTGNIDYEISNLEFGGNYVPSYSIVTGPREDKYVEFFGSMHGRFANSTFFNFTCVEEQTPFSIILKTEKLMLSIYEELGKYYIQSVVDNKIFSEEKILYMPYQSEISNISAEDIINNGECSLTEFTESAKLHTILLRSYLSYLSAIKDENIKVCPIT